MPQEYKTTSKTATRTKAWQLCQMNPPTRLGPSEIPFCRIWNQLGVRFVSVPSHFHNQVHILNFNHRSNKNSTITYFLCFKPWFRKTGRFVFTHLNRPKVNFRLSSLPLHSGPRSLGHKRWSAWPPPDGKKPRLAATIKTAQLMVLFEGKTNNTLNNKMMLNGWEVKQNDVGHGLHHFTYVLTWTT